MRKVSKIAGSIHFGWALINYITLCASVPIVKSEAICGAETTKLVHVCLSRAGRDTTDREYFLVHMRTHCYYTVKLIPWVCITHGMMNISTFKIFIERDFTGHSFTVLALKETSKY